MRIVSVNALLRAQPYTVHNPSIRTTFLLNDLVPFRRSYITVYTVQD